MPSDMRIVCVRDLCHFEALTDAGKWWIIQNVDNPQMGNIGFTINREHVEEMIEKLQEADLELETRL